MSMNVIIIIVILIIAIILFITEFFSFDITALIILALLLFSGILTIEEGLSGFSNPATITIGAIFILSEGVRKTGFLNLVSKYFSRLADINSFLAISIIMITIALVSSFINNTAAVVIFIPVIMTISEKMKQSPSKLLMPLSFASIFGGICTLIGTSTNILVNSIAVKHGIEGLKMFDFTPVGIILLAAGFLYMLLFGIRSIPERRKREDLTESYDMNPYISDILLTEGFEGDGNTINEIQNIWGMDIDIVHVYRKKKIIEVNIEKTSIHAGDILRVRGSADEFSRLNNIQGITIMPSHKWADNYFEEENHTLIEVVIAPECACVTQMIDNINLYEKYGAVILGIRSRGKIRHKRLGKMRLSAGDTVLMSISYSQIDAIQKDPSFILISDITVEPYRKNKMPVALAILCGVIVLSVLNLVPIVIGAIVGVILLVLTDCLTSEEVYQAINWRIIFLLAGVIPLGIAIDNSGLAHLFSELFIDFFGGMGPTAVMSGFFVIVMLLSFVVNNQATAAIFAPIAIDAARTMGVSPYPMIMAVAYGASLSFITPIGYHTNTIIYNTGHYKFRDFVKIGTPLNIIFWIVATLVIPLIWKF